MVQLEVGRALFFHCIFPFMLYHIQEILSCYLLGHILFQWQTSYLSFFYLMKSWRSNCLERGNSLSVELNSVIYSSAKLCDVIYSSAKLWDVPLNLGNGLHYYARHTHILLQYASTW